MTVGPMVVACGMLLLRAGRARRRRSATTVLPGSIVLGLGLALTVAPLTATVLAAVDDERLGIASGVNNAVARLAGCWPSPCCRASSGSTRAPRPARVTAGFHRAMVVSAALCVLGGGVAFLTVRRARRGPRASHNRWPSPASTRASSSRPRLTLSLESPGPDLR